MLAVEEGPGRRLWKGNVSYEPDLNLAVWQMEGVCLHGQTVHAYSLQASHPFQILYSSALKAQQPRQEMSAPLITVLVA